MGGGGGGTGGIRGLSELVKKAKEELQKDASQGEEPSRHNVFISFAYEDINDVNLLRGQAKNENSPIEFNDWSVSEPFNSEKADYIKKKIEERINACSVTVVYLSEDTIKSRWVEWEIQKSLSLKKRVIGVYNGEKKPTSVPKAMKDNAIKTVSWSKLAKEIADS